MNRRVKINGYAIMGGFVAGLIAAAVAVIEVSSALLCRVPGRPATRWWMPRLAVDFLIGVVGLVVVRSTAHGDWASGPKGWIVGGFVGGLVGPIIIRSRVFTVGRDNEAKPIGPGVVYDLVRDFFESKIDEFGATRDATWIEDEVIPAALLRGNPPRHVGQLLTHYVRARRSLTDARRKAEVAAVVAVLNDAGTTGEEKVRQLVTQAQELRAFSLLKSIAEAPVIATIPSQIPAKPRDRKRPRE